MVLVCLGGTCVPWPESGPDQVCLMIMHWNTVTQHPSGACYPCLGVRWWCHPGWQVILRLPVSIRHPPKGSKKLSQLLERVLPDTLSGTYCCSAVSSIDVAIARAGEPGLQSSASPSSYFRLTLKKPEAWTNYVQLKFNYVQLNCLFCLCKLSIRLSRTGIMYNLCYCHSMAGFFCLSKFLLLFFQLDKAPNLTVTGSCS